MLHGGITEKVIGCAMKVHRTLGPGFLESVYQNSLLHELRKAGLATEREKPLRVFYDAVVVGEFQVDIFVEGRILLEIKAVRALTGAHEAQVVNYLTATRIDIGLLINFGAESLEFKRKHRLYRAQEESDDHLVGDDDE